MDGDKEWLIGEGGAVDEEAEAEDNSLASNSSGSDSFAESSMESSRVEIEDVTDEDCAERRFQVHFIINVTLLTFLILKL